MLSRVQLFVTPWTIVCQAPLFMEFLRQEYQNGFPFPSPGDLPNPKIKPMSLALTGRFFTTEPLGKPQIFIYFRSSRSKLQHVESVLLIWNNYRWWIYATCQHLYIWYPVVKTLFFHIKNLCHPSAPGTCNQEIREALKLKPKAQGWTKCLIVNLALSSQLHKSACYSYVELNLSKEKE